MHDAIYAQPGAIRLVVRKNAETLKAIAARLARVGIGVAGMEQITPSLEDVFVSRVRAEGGAVEG